MKQEYFIYNGKKYNSGTIIIVDHFCICACKLYRAKAEFLYYDTEEDKYAYKIYGEVIIDKGDNFKKNFHGVYDKNAVKPMINTTPKIPTFKDELNIDGLFLAWLWYVFIMVVAIIFYDRILIWILESIIFFNYRNKKLKEAGYK